MHSIKSSINKIAIAPVNEMPIDIPKIKNELEFYGDIYKSTLHQNGIDEAEDWIKSGIGKVWEYFHYYKKMGIRHLGWQEMDEVYSNWNLRELNILMNRMARIGK